MEDAGLKLNLLLWAVAYLEYQLLYQLLDKGGANVSDK